MGTLSDNWTDRFTEWLVDTVNRTGLSHSTLAKWAAAGRFAALKVGRKWKIDPASLNEYLRSLNPGA
jgi:excisionase family DNA binding protein